MMTKYAPEGNLLPVLENRFAEIQALINKTDNGIKSAVSGKISYIHPSRSFLIIDFGQNVKGWLSGAQSAIDEKSKGYLNIGDIIDVEITGYNSEKSTFTCQRKTRVIDAIEYQKTHYQQGMVIDAKVTRRMKYGYFCDIGGGNTVLLHNSEISPKYSKTGYLFFDLYQTISVKITGYNPQIENFTISYKAVSEDEKLRIGNTVAVILDDNTIEGWSCHFCMDSSIKGTILGKKQNATYETGDMCRVTVIGFKGGIKLAFI